MASTFSENKSLEKLNQQMMRVLAEWVEKGILLRPSFRNLEGAESWSMYELCTMINWLYNTGNNKTTLYESLVKLLEEEASNISSRQMDPYYGMIKDILNPGELVANSSYDLSRFHNPVLSIIKSKII